MIRLQKGEEFYSEGEDVVKIGWGVADNRSRMWSQGI